MDMNSCFGSSTWTLAQRHAGCRPKVTRIPFQDTWTQQRDQTTNQLEPGSAACHDITNPAGRLYCAGVNASLIIDVSGLLDSAGKIKGTSFSCPVIDGTRTGAKVTDCSGMEAGQAEQAPAGPPRNLPASGRDGDLREPTYAIATRTIRCARMKAWRCRTKPIRLQTRG